MTILRIAVVGVAIVVFMAVAQDQRWPQKVGAVGVCGATAAPSSAPTGYWYSCKQGLVNGFPNLEADRCTNVGVVRDREYWQCDVPLTSLPGA
ncbi:hypothetical protein [Gaiella sp.]|uniref:hypothetical protein n=1 Tax=Gaiella sp. TaxID=2663207 RepID=UPI003263F88C